jgi:branched-chain amino acid transport system permease protein
MIQSLVYGLTIGAILYFFSIGLSITFGTMQIINFAHGIVYALGVYFFISLLSVFGGMVPLAICGALIFVAPLAYATERFVIRRLYGESLDYAMIATYALLLIGTDIIKFFWGTTPYPVTDPIGTSVQIFGFTLPVYRILIIVLAVLLFLGLNQFTKRTVVGKIIVAALEDKDGVRCLGISVDRYFSGAFILGSLLAVMGGVLYAPISTAEPYMGYNILLIAFAVVITGGMGSFIGTFVAAFGMGLVIAITGRFWSQAADTMVFVVMALVLFLRREEQIPG